MSSSTTTPEQLTLLPEATVPVQFRLDEATRRRGLRHIAEIRAQLERNQPALDTTARPSRRAPQHRRTAA